MRKLLLKIAELIFVLICVFISAVLSKRAQPGVPPESVFWRYFMALSIAGYSALLFHPRNQHPNHGGQNEQKEQRIKRKLQPVHLLR